MKAKKLLLVVLLVLVLIAGWLLAVVHFTGVQKEQEQKKLVDQAAAYQEKELYVRAVPLYQQALSQYHTDNNDAIEGELAQCYLEYQDYDKYIDMITDRDEKGTATEQEYLNVMQVCMDNGGANYDDVLKLVWSGYEKTGSDKLYQSYDENAYLYSSSTTQYQEIKTCKFDDKTPIPAFDGEKWQYIDLYGWATDDHTYDMATAFNANGYAAVKDGSNVYCILENGDHYGMSTDPFTDIKTISGSRIIAQKDGKYSYYDYDFNILSEQYQFDDITATGNGVAAVKNGKWGIITSKGETVTDFLYEDVAVNSLGSCFSGNAAMLQESDEKWYLTDTSGAHISDEGFFGAKAPESEDGYIAVENEDGKWGFIDRTGKLVIDYQYDDAKSFSDGLAPVLADGYWEYISATGMIQIKGLTLSDADPCHNGYAAAKSEDGAVILKLRYCAERDD